MMIGTLFSALRISRQTSRPLIFGSITSRMITSGADSEARRSPAAPSRARVTAYPSYSNPSRRAATIESSSSTIRTLGMSRPRFGALVAGVGHGPAGRGGHLVPLQGKPDGEQTPLPRLALDRDRAPVHPHDVLHN